jgi:hypothetical protein
MSLICKRIPMKGLRMKHPWSDLRMGGFGGEMHLPSKFCRSMALFMSLSEAKPRSVDRSWGLSWFVVPSMGMVVGIKAHLPKQPCPIMVLVL